MDSNLIFSIISLLIFLLISIFSASARIAYLSVSDLTITKIKKLSSPSAERTLKLLEHPQRLFLSILFYNIFSTVVFTVMSAVLLVKLFNYFGIGETSGEIVAIFIISFIIIFGNEVVARKFIKKSGERFIMAISLWLYVLSLLIYPIIYIFEKFIETLPFKVHFGFTYGMRESLKKLVETSSEETFEKHEKDLITSIFEFGEKTVKEIMIPRIDVVSVSSDISFEKLLEIFAKEGHSRIPVYEKDIDNIKGVVHVKDLLQHIQSKIENFNLLSITRPAYFVPETKLISELLKELQKQKLHIAIVVDEYGGTSGIITLEDILEQIVGEIDDEYDVKIFSCKKISEGLFIVDARMNIDELNRELELDLPTEEGFETVGGFVLHLMGRMPKEKESVEYKNLKFTVEKIKGLRILELKFEITRVPESVNHE